MNIAFDLSGDKPALFIESNDYSTEREFMYCGGLRIALLAIKGRLSRVDDPELEDAYERFANRDFDLGLWRLNGEKVPV